ncbi:MAG: hypothetical protein CL799_11010 [Chromatiales bacterium]|jgi:hypothetical protein|nr:hypothetical protein [Chromatiales bacterium]MDP6150897.1 hypothetical protein [Gammaproteobacteria bacterium]MDP7094330.1 hypothetical protein [Gammaproteobacteria bacterium]MDP7271733.1 hypothetical protein [Gammaproteobacteria bacterium]HJP03608.1 hypothetical protein [Gammaproteobacteria bacterium]
MHEFLLILHLLLFCYWLGGDIGVFYSSGFAANPKLSLEARMTAAKIMLNLDIVPRLCGAVMLTVGGLLSEFVGVTHPAWQMYAIIAVAPAWLALELVLHFKHDTPLGKGMAKFDDPFKWLIVIACVASAAWSFSTGRLDEAPWVGYKVLVFALIMFFSLMINRTIGPYIVGIQRIAEGKIDEAENAAMAASLKQVKWAVIGIWIALVVEAVLGVAKPGG